MHHGIAVSNRKGIYAGWSDEELTKFGIRCIKKNVKHIKKYNVKKIFSLIIPFLVMEILIE